MEIDPATISQRDAYALMISSIVPRPIAWVSTISKEGARNLAPFSFFMGVGSKPPMLAVSVGWRKGESKDTARNIRATEEFVVNIVPEKLAQKMVLTSGEYPPEVDEFDKAGLAAVTSIRVKPPGVLESPIRMECRLSQIIQPGTNPTDLILGEIVHFTIADDIMKNGLPDASLLDPLARLGKQEYASVREIISIDRPSH